MSRWKHFWKGFIRVFDLSNIFHTPKLLKRFNKTAEQAIAEDWENVGNDFRKVMGLRDEEN